MKQEKVIFYCFAIIWGIGGILGLIKGLIPNMELLNFRYLIFQSTTFEELPLYANIYGVIMALLEIIAAVFLFLQKKKMLLFVTIVIIINMLGCILAILAGDLFAVFVK